jgi:L-ascorbate metabolism protein UlaG (beta-lactamase superfamily)
MWPGSGSIATDVRMTDPTRRQLFRTAALAALAPLRLAAAEAGPAAAPTLRAQRLAWAGIRLQLGKDAVFLDPLISADVWGAALKDSLVPVEEVEGRRWVLITHPHPDHFDKAAARSVLGEKGSVACAADVAATVAAAGFRVRPVGLYEPALLADFTATPVPAADGNGDTQVSWVVSGGGRKVIHCGDTMWHAQWWQIGRQHGPFDAAFLPINGALFGWRKPESGVPAVLTPEQAAAAGAILGARLIVPIHYGVVGAEAYTEVSGAEAALLEAAARRGIRVEIREPGEWLKW